jgi:hypothetical protein
VRWIAPLSLAGLVTLAACPAAKSVDCGGWTCREGNVCAAAPTYCAPPAAVEACLGQGLADLQACTLPGASGDSAVCRGGACFSCAATPDIEGCTQAGWTAMMSPTTTDLTSVLADARGDAYAGGADGSLLHYDGVAWSRVSAAPSVPRVAALAGSGPSDVYVAGSNNRVFHFDGTSWTDLQSPAPTITGIWSPGPGAVIVWGLSGAWQYAGGAWNATPLYSGRIDAIAGTGPADLFAFSTIGNVSTIRHYDGATWTTQDQTTNNAVLSGIWAAGSSVAFAVGVPGTGINVPLILRFDGSAWNDDNSSGVVGVRLASVWAADVDHAFAAGDNNTLLAREAGTWQIMCSTPYDRSLNLVAVHGSGPDDVFAVGTSGTILHYTGIVGPAVTGTCH